VHVCIARRLSLSSSNNPRGGNYFMLGGALSGGRVLGQFPSDISDAGPASLGRGRLVPTMGWEAVWNAVAGWFGVDEDLMPTVLPNRENFADDEMLHAADVYATG
jgi:uncharacterized protein (DUF1501 family)